MLRLLGYQDDATLASKIKELDQKLRTGEFANMNTKLTQMFAAQNELVQLMKEENIRLKMEIAQLRATGLDAEKVCLAVTQGICCLHKLQASGLQNTPIYPKLRTVKCYVKWSTLENNPIESRIVEVLRSILVRVGVELQVLSWPIPPAPQTKTGEQAASFTLVFCPRTSKIEVDLEQALRGLTAANSRSVFVAVLHNVPPELSDRAPSTRDELMRFSKMPKREGAAEDVASPTGGPKPMDSSSMVTVFDDSLVSAIESTSLRTALRSVVSLIVDLTVWNRLFTVGAANLARLNEVHAFVRRSLLRDDSAATVVELTDLLCSFNCGAPSSWTVQSGSDAAASSATQPSQSSVVAANTAASPGPASNSASSGFPDLGTFQRVGSIPFSSIDFASLKPYEVAARASTKSGKQKRGKKGAQNGGNTPPSVATPTHSGSNSNHSGSLNGDADASGKV